MPSAVSTCSFGIIHLRDLLTKAINRILGGIILQIPYPSFPLLASNATACRPCPNVSFEESLLASNIAIEGMALEIVSFPSKNGDFPVPYANVYQRVITINPRV